MIRLVILLTILLVEAQLQADTLLNIKQTSCSQANVCYKLSAAKATLGHISDNIFIENPTLETHGNKIFVGTYGYIDLSLGIVVIKNVKSKKITELVYNFNTYTIELF